MTIKERLIKLIKMSYPLSLVRCRFFNRQLKLVFFAFCLVFCGCHHVVETATIHIPEQEIVKEKLVLHPNEGLVYFLKQPFSGYSIRYYSNGTLAERIGYWQGKKQGTYQKWYNDGILSFEANYNKGRKDGISKTWWRNGLLRSESIHAMGKTNGSQKQWYKNGQLFKSMNIVDGKEVGLQQAWRENGKIYNNYEAKNGRIFGLKRASLCYELEDEMVQYAED